MNEILIRSAQSGDLPRLTEIYNHYVLTTPITFDLEPYTVERRMGRHRLLVAESNGVVIGYAGTTRFRPKPAYDTTVETTIYLSAEAAGKGVGSRLYAALFQALANEDIHRIVAGYALPNSASKALHERFGFQLVGIFRENGRKFGRYWDVAWSERPLRLEGK